MPATFERNGPHPAKQRHDNSVIIVFNIFPVGRRGNPLFLPPFCEKGIASSWFNQIGYLKTLLV